MKKFIFGFVALLIATALVVPFCIKDKKEESYLRIHIRANSNLECDQAVKYKVKEAVVDFLTPKVAEAKSFDDVYNILDGNLDEIEKVADDVLLSSGFQYKSKAALKDEYFPTRSYSGYTLENGFYDALILNLGTGEGNNWWCVVYPPLCFISSEGSNPQNIKYKSKLVELVNKFFH